MSDKIERVLKLFVNGEPVFMYGRFKDNFDLNNVIITIADSNENDVKTYQLKVI